MFFGMIFSCTAFASYPQNVDDIAAFLHITSSLFLSLLYLSLLYLYTFISPADFSFRFTAAVLDLLPVQVPKTERHPLVEPDFARAVRIIFTKFPPLLVDVLYTLPVLLFLLSLLVTYTVFHIYKQHNLTLVHSLLW